MNPLDDEELTSLLKQAKGESPEPPREMATRTLRAYKAAIVERTSWQDFFRRPLPIPWPIGAFAALVFVFIGALADHTLTHPSKLDVNRMNEARSSRPTVILSFKEFQPVSELRPRVIRRISR
jgi:hypothetical protein